MIYVSFQKVSKIGRNYSIVKQQGPVKHVAQAETLEDWYGGEKYRYRELHAHLPKKVQSQPCECRLARNTRH